MIYISLDKLLEFPIRRDKCDDENANEHFINGIESVLEYAKNLPKEDVTEVRHGKWIEKDGVVFCSECGKPASYSGGCHFTRTFYYDYSEHCHNCGTIMDGKGNV